MWLTREQERLGDLPIGCALGRMRHGVDEPPRVAVVIPCHNDGRYLPEALASASQQETCELVVVDDGSDDAQTIEVLRKTEGEGVRVLRQENAGPARARMAGVEATSARFVQPLDADDRLVPGAVTALADALDGAPQAQMCWGDTQSFGARKCLHPRPEQLDPWRITYLAEIPGSSMVRREALEAVGGWNSVRGYEDWDLWMKFAGRGWTGVRLPSVFLFYREHPTPRLYARHLARHEELRAVLRSRHETLFRARSLNRRNSRSSRAIKMLFPLIDHAPLLSERQREKLWVRVRDVFEPGLKPRCQD